PPTDLLLVRPGLSAWRGSRRSRVAAFWRGTLRVPPALTRLPVLQLVAQEYREGQAVSSGFESPHGVRRAPRRRHHRSALVARRLESLRRHRRRPCLHLRTAAAVVR